jgi:hypothetical protein
MACIKIEAQDFLSPHAVMLLLLLQLTQALEMNFLKLAWEHHG